MKDFKKDLIARLENALPELKDKIQAGAVDAETPVPYAAFNVPEEVPLRTIHGIAGFAVSFDLAVYHNKLSPLETLKCRIISCLDGCNLAGKKCSLRSAEYAFYPDYSIHGYTISLKLV